MHSQPPDDSRQTLTGVVIKKTIGAYSVYVDGRTIPCTLANRLRKQLIYPTADPHSLRHVVQEVRPIDPTDPIAIGDQVRLVETNPSAGQICEILPRRSQLARQAARPGVRVFGQTIVANIDQIMAVFAAAQPAPHWNLLDRYLVAAEAAGIPACIVITKVDLLRAENGSQDDELSEAIETYRRIGYHLLMASSASGQGLVELKDKLQGNITLLIGKSGVGKTSLLNALQPGLGLRVGSVSQKTGKGKHTTTSPELFPLELGGDQPTAVVDTPGLREFGLWEIPPGDLADCFPEMRPYLGHCKFGLGCRHDHEPGCAIRKAVVGGQISPQRYQSLLRMTAEV